MYTLSGQKECYLLYESYNIANAVISFRKPTSNANCTTLSLLCNFTHQKGFKGCRWDFCLIHTWSVRIWDDLVEKWWVWCRIWYIVYISYIVTIYIYIYVKWHRHNDLQQSMLYTNKLQLFSKITLTLLSTYYLHFNPKWFCFLFPFRRTTSLINWYIWDFTFRLF